MADLQIQEYSIFIKDIKDKIYKSQYEALKILNTALINLYWDIGEEIFKQQKEKGWGKSIVEILANELQNEFPGIKGFSAGNLWRMRNFYISYVNDINLAPLVREISWTKNIIIMEKCKDKLEQEFYIKMTRRFGWTKNMLINNIESKAYEKYLLNQTNFDETVPEKYRQQAKFAVKDEYTFDFLEMGIEHSEQELEIGLINKRNVYGDGITKGISGLPGIYPPKILEGGKSAYWFYMFRLDEKLAGVSRDEFCNALSAEGVSCQAGYIPTCVYEYDLFTNKTAYEGTNCPFDCKYYGKEINYYKGMCPVAEEILNTAIRVVVSEFHTEQDMKEVI